MTAWYTLSLAYPGSSSGPAQWVEYWLCHHDCVTCHGWPFTFSWYLVVTVNYNFLDAACPTVSRLAAAFQISLMACEIILSLRTIWLQNYSGLSLPKGRNGKSIFALNYMQCGRYKNAQLLHLHIHVQFRINTFDQRVWLSSDWMIFLPGMH